MYSPMLSAEQQFVVDGTEAQPFWEYWVDRHVNHGDRAEGGFPIIRCRAGHYVVKSQKDPADYREMGGGSSLGFGGHQWKFVLEDGSELSSNDVWFQGVIPLKYRRHLPDNAETAGRSYDDHQPWGTAEEATLAKLSVFTHPTLAIDFHKAKREEVHGEKVYTIEFDESTRRPAPLEESQVWTSQVVDVPQPDGNPLGGITITNVSTGVMHSPERGKPKATMLDGKFQQVQDGWHTVMLDIDHPVRLVPSTTIGHWHLYIDVAMPWSRYKRLLLALAHAGVVEKGYVNASIQRGFTALRLPWVKKEAFQPPETPAQEGDPF